MGKIVKKTKKITALFLAGSMIVGSVPVQTNCGLFSIIKKKKYMLKAIGHYSLALGAIFAMHATKKPAQQKIKLPKGNGHFYASNFGKTILGTVAFPKMLSMLKVFGKSSQYKESGLLIKAIVFTFFGVLPLCKYMQSAASLVFGPDLFYDDE